MVNRSAEYSESRNLLNLMSHWALDAPLVAGSWWSLFSISFRDTFHWSILFSLFPAVWSIYLFDRLYDVVAQPAGSQSRKQFALRKSGLLRALFIVAVVWALGVAWFLPREIWKQAAAIGGVTVLYFLICRWKVFSTKIPVKEILIGFCFGAGIGLPFEIPLVWPQIAVLMVFGILCSLNCLIISRAEAAFDAGVDRSAWFSVSDRSFPFRSVFAGCGVATILLLGFGGILLGLGAALLVSTSFLYLLFVRSGKGSSDRIQPLSDGALWISALVGCGLEVLW